ncbi:Nuclear transcription factor Y subunit B-6 [Hibiscus syriacus]|uniref:Nuclear transcription factor Y subunit B-6 n=1 Tax=Hibiscus syriacus TaxID=106335 RepID=A0A6A3AC02_HIBSY|nr:Nuclear transcription factor Y subunit B-6 [Hibiscus syriacus]
MNGAKRSAEAVGCKNASVGERSALGGSTRVSGSRRSGRENVGLSNANIGENPMPRKPKGSFASSTTVHKTTNKSNPTPPEAREQDHFMPIANVIGIMRRVLPPLAKISDGGNETVQECVSELISFITGEANGRCQREQLKTVAAEDVLWAIGKLGFDDYVEQLTVFLNRYSEAENDKTSLRNEPVLKRGMIDGHAPPPPLNAPPFPVFLDANYAFAGRYNRIRDASVAAAATTTVGSCPQAPENKFDPFGQFK